MLAWYLSRRIATPVLELSRAADQVAEGKYDIDIPVVPSKDEVGHLAERFRQMASRLAEAETQERNFLMSVSHELRTPLTAIRGHADALREGLIDEEEMRQASLDVIAVEADRLERLVGDVLDLAKLDAHRFTVLREEVDMGSLIDQVYAAFGEEAKRRGIDYSCDAHAKPVIVTDGDRVFQIVSNLVSNAFRWTPDGGRVSLALAQTNGAVSVSVPDTGPGIKHIEQERIFRPFWSRDSGGTGLGLAIARELAVTSRDRSRVSFFMNKFRKLGFIHYNGQHRSPQFIVECRSARPARSLDADAGYLEFDQHRFTVAALLARVMQRASSLIERFSQYAHADRCVDLSTHMWRPAHDHYDQEPSRTPLHRHFDGERRRPATASRASEQAAEQQQDGGRHGRTTTVAWRRRRRRRRRTEAAAAATRTRRGGGGQRDDDDEEQQQQ